MEVTFTDFNPHTPLKERYEYVVDYISHSFDLDFEDAFYLIKQLKNHRSSVVVYAKAIADFQFYDGVLCVQIDSAGFWFAENLDLETARSILKLVYDGYDYFGQFLPNTNKEWEAYTHHYTG